MKRALLIILLSLVVPSFAGAQRRPTVLTPDRGSWIGVGVSDVTGEKLGALKLKEEQGVEIVTISPNSPAQQAGLKEHDVALEFNGVRVDSVEQFRRMIRETPAGRTVKLLISRDGAQQTVNVKIGERPGGARLLHEPEGQFSFNFPKIEIPEMPAFQMLVRNSRLGIEGESLTKQLGEFFGVPGGEGILVRSVTAGSPAEKAGLKAGDVIIKVGGESVKDMGGLRSALRERTGKGSFPITVIRNKREMTLTVSMERAELPGERV